MKKKVRIYKAGGDTGAYINKTAKWMMDMGGVPDISQLGYPSQQQEQQEMSPDMLMNSVITDLSNQVPENKIAFKLISIHKLQPVQAKQLIDSVKSSLVNTEEEEDEEMVATNKVSDNPLDDEENIVPEEDFETEDEIALAEEDTYEDVDDNQFAADLIMKYGGSKRNYVNSVLKLVKKNLGGDTKKDDADPIGEDVRDNMKKSFIGTLQNQSTLAKAKEQAEKEYEQLLQMQQQSTLQNFIPEEQDYMQFGGQRRAMRQFNRAMRKMPIGFTGPVTKFDVRRSGIFGRPKEYSMEFGANPLMQLASNPFLSSMYGYGTTTKTIKTPGRIGTEAIAKTTNKKATEEVASQNTTDAANTSAKQPTLEEMRAAATAAGDWGYTPPQTNVVDNTTEATSGNASGNTQSSVENENDVVVKPSVKKDKWGRSEGDKWYGFDPESKQFTIGETPEWYNPSQENTNEDEIQGSADGFKKFGQAQMQSWAANDPAKYYNPNTGKYEYRPMSALADDELISTAVLGAPNWGMNFGSKGVEFLTNRLIGSGAKGASSKLGSTAAKQFLGKGQNMLNPGQRMLNQGQNMLNRGQGMLNPGQRMLNPPPGFQYKMPFQSGGLVNNPMSDPYGNLQRFIYGGNDIDQADIDDVYSKDTTDPYFQYGGLTQYQGDKEGSQTDENCRPPFTNCFPNKNTTNKTPEELQKELLEKFNPKNTSTDVDADTDADTDYETRLAEEKKKWEKEFMQKQSPFGSTPNMLGNFGKQITEGYGYNPFINNRALSGMPQYAGSWDKTMRAPYDKRTGQQFAGMQGFNPNAQISNIDVTKTGMLGRPKKYSVTYNNNPSGKPEDRRLAGTAPSITTPKGSTVDKQNTSTNTEGLGAGATGAIRRGERRTAKELGRGEKQNLSASDANLDPYAGFPLDHPIRDEKLATNSVKDYLKPSQASPSKLIDGKYDLNGDPISQTSTATTAPRMGANGRPVGNIAYQERMRKERPSKEKLDELYSRDVFDDYRYGGGLHKFLPQAEPGLETPVTQDERFELEPLPIVSAKDAFKPIYDESQKRLQDQATYEPDEYTVDYKRKDIRAGDLGEALPMVNAGLTGVAGLIDKFKNKRRERKRYDKLNIENLVAVDPSPNKGYEDTNSGLAGDMGQRASSQSKQYGGSMDDYYEEGGIVDMTEEDLANFLANGGEVEYL